MLNRGIEKEKYEGEFDEIMLDVFKEYLRDETDGLMC